MPTNYWLRRAACRLRREATGSGEPPAELQLPNRRRGSGGPKRRDCGASHPFGQGCTGRPSVSEQAKCTRRQEGCPHHRLVEQESQMQTCRNDSTECHARKRIGSSNKNAAVLQASRRLVHTGWVGWESKVREASRRTA